MAVPPLRVPVPIEAPPSRKVTVPVSVPAPGATAVTFAVKITDWCKAAEFCELARTVTVAVLLTTCGFPVSVPPLALKLALPAYVVVIV